MVFQIQLTRANDTTPMTRDYMVDVERELAKADSAARAPRKAPAVSRPRKSAGRKRQDS